jgi:hypothetical protein
MKYLKVKWGRRGGEEVQIIRERVPTEEGDLALKFATHFAVIAAVEDGYDEAGRAKLRLQTVDEIVQRACDLAEKMTAALRKREWILDLPIPEPPQPEELMPKEELRVRPAKDSPPPAEEKE